MSNYPPGVTGFEDAFGPRFEHEEVRLVECEDCGWKDELPVLRQGWSTGMTDYWQCPGCQAEHDDDVEDEAPDYERERYDERDYYGEHDPW